MEKKNTIKLENRVMYLLKLKFGYEFPSKHCIAEYYDGFFFEEQTNSRISEDEIDSVLLKLKA